MDKASVRARLEEIERRIVQTKERLAHLRAMTVKQELAGKLKARQADAVLRSLERSLFVLEDIRTAVKSKLDEGTEGTSPE